MNIMTVSILSAFLTPAAVARTFPPDFRWCVATAGHQVEGDNIHSDWWEFEQRPGAIKNGDRSGKASHHMDRLEEDVKIMKDLGVKAYRFSMEWSRLEPREGEFDQSAVQHYKRELDLLERAGIEPFVTIHHFVQPKWFSDGGGWTREDAPEIFLRHVERLEAAFGSRVKYWVTFNEPTVLLIQGYGEGNFAPGEKNWRIWKPIVQLLKAHALAYRHLHERAKAEGREVHVGLAHHIRPVYTPHAWLRPLLRWVDDLTNWNVPRAVETGEVHGVDWKGIGFLKIPWPAHVSIPELKGTQDFLGINYYTREYVTISWKKPFLFRDPFPGLEGSELNWGLDPEGFLEVLTRAHREFPRPPFYITENGLADAQDKWRAKYLVDHLHILHRAMTELPHPVIGYCHWSLLDNFEWAEGFWPRFGLYEVDYVTGERRARPSAEVARRIFRTGELPTN